MMSNKNDDDNVDGFRTEAAEYAVWFECLSRKRRRHVLASMLRICTRDEDQYIADVLDRRVGGALVGDFTRLFNRDVCYLIFQHLDPRSACRAASTCHQWRTLCIADKIWKPNCLRMGWNLTYIPAHYEHGAWYGYYSNCVKSWSTAATSAVRLVEEQLLVTQIREAIATPVTYESPSVVASRGNNTNPRNPIDNNNDDDDDDDDDDGDDSDGHHHNRRNRQNQTTTATISVAHQVLRRHDLQRELDVLSITQRYPQFATQQRQQQQQQQQQQQHHHHRQQQQHHRHEQQQHRHSTMTATTTSDALSSIRKLMSRRHDEQRGFTQSKPGEPRSQQQQQQHQHQHQQHQQQQRVHAAMLAKQYTREKEFSQPPPTFGTAHLSIDATPNFDTDTVTITGVDVNSSSTSPSPSTSPSTSRLTSTSASRSTSASASASRVHSRKQPPTSAYNRNNNDDHRYQLRRRHHQNERAHNNNTNNNNTNNNNNYDTNHGAYGVTYNETNIDVDNVDVDDVDVDDTEPTRRRRSNKGVGPRVVLVSSATQARALLVDAVRFDVVCIPYETRPGSLSSIVEKIKFVLDGERAQSVGVVCESLPGELRLCDYDGGRITLPKLSGSNHEQMREQAEFFRTLRNLIVTRDEGGRFDIFTNTLTNSVSGLELVTIIEHIVDVMVVCPRHPIYTSDRHPWTRTHALAVGTSQTQLYFNHNRLQSWYSIHEKLEPFCQEFQKSVPGIVKGVRSSLTRSVTSEILTLALFSKWGDHAAILVNALEHALNSMQETTAECVTTECVNPIEHVATCLMRKHHQLFGNTSTNINNNNSNNDYNNNDNNSKNYNKNNNSNSKSNSNTNANDDDDDDDLWKPINEQQQHSTNNNNTTTNNNNDYNYNNTTDDYDDDNELNTLLDEIEDNSDCDELVRTEHLFVYALRQIRDIYATPLLGHIERSQSKSNARPPINTLSHKMLFTDTTAVLALHEPFLASLEKAVARQTQSTRRGGGRGGGGGGDDGGAVDITMTRCLFELLCSNRVHKVYLDNLSTTLTTVETLVQKSDVFAAFLSQSKHLHYTSGADLATLVQLPLLRLKFYQKILQRVAPRFNLKTNTRLLGDEGNTFKTKNKNENENENEHTRQLTTTKKHVSKLLRLTNRRSPANADKQATRSSLHMYDCEGFDTSCIQNKFLKKIELTLVEAADARGGDDDTYRPMHDVVVLVCEDEVVVLFHFDYWNVVETTTTTLTSLLARAHLTDVHVSQRTRLTSIDTTIPPTRTTTATTSSKITPPPPRPLPRYISELTIGSNRLLLLSTSCEETQIDFINLVHDAQENL